MKSKITISIDEKILYKIDKDVRDLKGKNRSQIIEGILKDRYGDFADLTAIIFSHDYKWDDGEYPFEFPKGLININGESIISKQLLLLIESGVRDIIVAIPKNTKSLFLKEFNYLLKDININFIEFNIELKTGEVLKDIIENQKLNTKLMILNGDIFFGELNIYDYFQYYLDQKADFSFLLRFVNNPEKLGNVQINGNKVIGFVEKPNKNNLLLTNSGMYITSRDFLQKNSFGNYLEYDFFPKLPNLGNIVGYVYNGEWEHLQSDSALKRLNISN